MTRKYVDCREYKGSNCTLKISGTEEEVFKTARDHGIKVHGYTDSPEFDIELRKSMKDELEEVRAGAEKVA